MQWGQFKRFNIWLIGISERKQGREAEIVKHTVLVWVLERNGSIGDMYIVKINKGNLSGKWSWVAMKGGLSHMSLLWREDPRGKKADFLLTQQQAAHCLQPIKYPTTALPNFLLKTHKSWPSLCLPDFPMVQNSCWSRIAILALFSNNFVLARKTLWFHF